MWQHYPHTTLMLESGDIIRKFLKSHLLSSSKDSIGWIIQQWSNYTTVYVHTHTLETMVCNTLLLFIILIWFTVNVFNVIVLHWQLVREFLAFNLTCSVKTKKFSYNALAKKRHKHPLPVLFRFLLTLQKFTQKHIYLFIHPSCNLELDHRYFNSKTVAPNQSAFLLVVIRNKATPLRCF